jgi:hypothetical protein
MWPAQTRSQVMVTTQRIHVGMIHARQIVTVSADDHGFGFAGRRALCHLVSSAVRRRLCATLVTDI